MSIINLALFLLGNGYVFAADFDFLDQRVVELNYENTRQLVEETINDLRGTLEHFEPALAGGEELTRPLEVTGPKHAPRITGSLKKCLFGFCREADLDMRASVEEVKGKCTRNWEINLDISRSSRDVSEFYDLIVIEACYRESEHRISLSALGKIRQAESHRQGIRQSVILNFLKKQIDPIVAAFRKAMDEKAG